MLHDRRVVDDADIQSVRREGKAKAENVLAGNRRRKIDEDRLFERAEQIVMRVVRRRAANGRIMIDLVGQLEREGAVAVDLQLEDDARDISPIASIRNGNAPDLVRV